MKKIVIGMALLMVVGGCASVPETAESKAVMSSQVSETITLFKAKDPTIERFFNQSYGYAVLPRVAKGGFWIGGATGSGEVFEQGVLVGHCSMNQATLGFTFGGQYFREIIFFRDREDLNRFRGGNYKFAAQITGVAIKSGVAAKAGYKTGMAVFVMAQSGLMVDASLGGQKFKYVPN